MTLNLYLFFVRKNYFLNVKYGVFESTYETIDTGSQNNVCV